MCGNASVSFKSVAVRRLTNTLLSRSHFHPYKEKPPLNFPLDKNSGNGFVLPDRRTRKAVNKSRGHTNSVIWQSGYRGRRNVKEKKEGERKRMWF